MVVISNSDIFRDERSPRKEPSAQEILVPLVRNDNKLAGDELIQIYFPEKPGTVLRTLNHYTNSYRLIDFWFHPMSFRHFL